MLSAERECCSSTADGPTNVSTLSSTQPLQLTDLPSDVLEAILSHLNAAELNHCRVCRCLRTAALSPSLWQRLCIKRWPDANIEPSTNALSNVYGCGGWRNLYKSMRLLEPLMHPVVWTEIQESLPPRPTSLICFKWVEGRAQCTKLCYDSSLGSPTASHIADVATSRHSQASQFATFDRLSDTEVMVTMATDQTASPLHCRPMPLSPAARAAADVASSGSYPSGASPPGSFNYEVGRFMQTIVAKRRNKSGRRSSKPDPSESRLCLSRVVRMQRSSTCHHLQGMWRMIHPHEDCGNLRQQSTIIRITYDFSGPHAYICGYKVNSLRALPAEQIAWEGRGGLEDRDLVFAAPAQDSTTSLHIQECERYIADDLVWFRNYLSGHMAPETTPGWNDFRTPELCQVTSVRHAEALTFDTAWQDTAMLLTLSGGSLALVQQRLNHPSVHLLTRLDGDLEQ